MVPGHHTKSKGEEWCSWKKIRSRRPGVELVGSLRKSGCGLLVQPPFLVRRMKYADRSTASSELWSRRTLLCLISVIVEPAWRAVTSMGGDDLNDEFLWASEPVVADFDASSSAEEEHPDQHTVGSKKRQQSPTNAGARKKKKKKQQQQQQSHPEQLLLEAGRRLDQQDSTQQAAFLTTALQHYSLLEQKQHRNDNAKPEILPSYCFAINKDEDGTRLPLVDRIRQAVSVQKMKKWKHAGSPCVVRMLVARTLHSHLNVCECASHAILCAFRLLYHSCCFR